MGVKIGIINYGIAGNIYNIKKAVEKAGGEPVIINAPEELETADKLIIPGVGSFKDAITELENDRLLEPLKVIIKTKPTLGICLGMQILSSIGFEYGEIEGLGMVEGKVKKITSTDKIPHVGFNNIIATKDSLLFKDIDLSCEEFYFMHSYEMTECNDISATTNYNEYNIVAAIEKDDIYGVQFHPEKSRDAGIKLFKNFIEM